MRVLVTGATGLIGRQLCAQLASDGYSLTVLTRNVESAKALPCQAVYAWQPEAGLPPQEAWQDVGAVIHLAGEPIAQRWTPAAKRRLRDSRVLSTRHLVTALQGLERAPRVFVSSSAVGFYGHRGDQWLTENAAAGEGFLRDICVEWENEALRAEALGVRVALMRIGVVLDPAGGVLQNMLPVFKSGFAGKLGDGRQWFPWIHRDDMLSLLRWALVTEQVRGPVNGVAPNPVTNEEFTKQLAAILHRPAWLPMPAFALKLLLGEMGVAGLASQRVMPQAALHAGFTFRFPWLREALQNLFKSS